MNPFERVHELIISGKVIGPDGFWISRTEALKEKRALLQHVLGGEVKISGTWTRLTDIPARSSVTELRQKHTPSPLAPPQPVRSREYEKETAVLPPPQFDIGQLRREQENHPARFEPPTLPPPLPIEPAAPCEVTPSPAIEDNAGNLRNFSVARSDTNEKLVPPPQIKPEMQPWSNPAPVSFPTQKPDMTTRQKASVADNHFSNEPVTTRTIPLGKESSFTISETPIGAALVAVCSVEGFIDQSNSDIFNLQLMSMLESGVRYFIITLERTVLVGSSGWGVLAVAARMIKVSGGRLLVCSMKPEIEESFNLLQFGDVIDARATPADSLDTIREIIQSQPAPLPSGNENGDDAMHGGESFAELPLPEKIKLIISRNGPLSLFQIAAHLRQNQYGNVKMGLIKLYALLKDLNLESNWKRIRYYRSC